MSVDAYKKDPLSGEEIMRISLESLGVDLNLTKSQVQIRSDFEVRSVEHGIEFISPSRKIGQISSLWRTIGSRVEDVIWDESVTIKTDCGIDIFIPPDPGGSRGSILTPEGEGTAWDDF